MDYSPDVANRCYVNSEREVAAVISLSVELTPAVELLANPRSALESPHYFFYDVLHELSSCRALLSPFHSSADAEF